MQLKLIINFGDAFENLYRAAMSKNFDAAGFGVCRPIVGTFGDDVASCATRAC